MKEKKLVITPEKYDWREEGFNFTKVLKLECFREDKPLIIVKQPKTWAGLAREVIRTFDYIIEAEVQNNQMLFMDKFNEALHGVIKESGVRPNTSFSEDLFIFPTNAEVNTSRGIYPDHLHSTVYMNNANSLLKIFEIPDSTLSAYITAVYSGEVVWVINALIKALAQYDVKVVITYMDREKVNTEKPVQMSIDEIETNNEEKVEDKSLKEQLNDIITTLEIVADASSEKLKRTVTSANEIDLANREMRLALSHPEETDNELLNEYQKSIDEGSISMLENMAYLRASIYCIKTNLNNIKELLS